MFRVGQGLFGRIRFADGEYPKYDRTYLVVDVTDDKVGVLNISSVTGKADRLLYPSNRYINKHLPPFKKRSFVKLDSLVSVPVGELSDVLILSNGDLLDYVELKSIINQIMK